MDRQQFRAWGDDFKARFPSTGDWLAKLPEATRNLWFDEVFARFELSDCLKVNRELMVSGELEAYQREKLPRIFMKRCQELEYEREQVRIKRMHERRQAEYQRGRTLGDLIESRFNPCMLRAYQETILAMHDARVKERPMSSDEITELAGKLIAEYDTNAEDDLQQQAYKCRTCRDTGFVGYEDSSERRYAGHCDCDLGMNRKESFKASGTSIGRAAANVTVQWSIE